MAKKNKRKRPMNRYHFDYKIHQNFRGGITIEAFNKKTAMKKFKKKKNVKRMPYGTVIKRY